MSNMQLKNGLLREVEENKREEQRQKQLREKHDLDENVIVVEKTNGFKFAVRLLIGILKGIAAILLLVLCAIGVISLIYPNIRIELFEVIEKILYEVQEMFGG